MISPHYPFIRSAGCLTWDYVETEKTHTEHTLSGIRTHDLSVGAGEDSSCLRTRGHCDRLNNLKRNIYYRVVPDAICTYYISQTLCLFSSVHRLILNVHFIFYINIYMRVLFIYIHVNWQNSFHSLFNFLCSQQHKRLYISAEQTHLFPSATANCYHPQFSLFRLSLLFLDCGGSGCP
jgi:hypothetical protein